MKKLHSLLLCIIIVATTMAIVLTIVLVAYRPDESFNTDDHPDTTYEEITDPETTVTETTAPETAKDRSDDTSDKVTEPNTTVPENEVFTFGSTFVFNDLEITIGNAEDITWSTIDNQFSDKNGADVIVLPVTVKNLKDESHRLNMFYYKFYGSAGTEIKSVGTYFFDSDIGYAGDMRSGASITSAFHIVYDGDGDYYIEFNRSFATKKIEVKLPITK